MRWGYWGLCGVTKTDSAEVMRWVASSHTETLSVFVTVTKTSVWVNEMRILRWMCIDTSIWSEWDEVYWGPPQTDSHLKWMRWGYWGGCAVTKTDSVWVNEMRLLIKDIVTSDTIQRRIVSEVNEMRILRWMCSDIDLIVSEVNEMRLLRSCVSDKDG